MSGSAENPEQFQCRSWRLAWRVPAKVRLRPIICSTNIYLGIEVDLEIRMRRLLF
jgi:hypothetical protein